MSFQSWGFFTFSVIFLYVLAWFSPQADRLIAGLILVNYLALLAILFKDGK